MPETFESFAADLLGELRTMPDTIRTALERSAAVQAGLARRNAPRRTGRLRRSITARVGKDKATVEMPGEYAPVEFGGVIRPKRGSFLAVPVSASSRNLKGPRSDTAQLFTLTSRDGRVFLASRVGGGIELRWRLMRSVTVRGRHFMTKAHDAGANDLEGRLADDIEGALT